MVALDPAASKKRKAGEAGEDVDAGQRPRKLAKVCTVFSSSLKPH